MSKQANVDRLWQDVRQYYPYPLASVYRLTYARTQDLDEAHNNLVKLFEVSLKYLASIAVAQYLADKPGDLSINNSLESLARPSLGHWQAWLTKILNLYTRQNWPISIPELARFYRQKQGDHLLQLYLQFLEAWAVHDKYQQARSRGTVTARQFFDDVITYRNEQLAHGAGQPPRPQRERVAAALAPAMRELFANMAFLADYPLVYLSEIVRLPSPAGQMRQYKYRYLSLNGDSPTEPEPKVLANDNLEPGQLYLLSQKGDFEPILSLYPICIFQFCDGCNTDRVFVLNRTKGKVIEYISYECGHTCSQTKALDDLRSLLRSAGVKDGTADLAEEANVTLPETETETLLETATLHPHGSTGANQIDQIGSEVGNVLGSQVRLGLSRAPEQSGNRSEDEIRDRSQGEIHKLENNAGYRESPQMEAQIHIVPTPTPEERQHDKERQPISVTPQTLSRLKRFSEHARTSRLPLSGTRRMVSIGAILLSIVLVYFGWSTLNHRDRDSLSRSTTPTPSLGVNAQGTKVISTLETPQTTASALLNPPSNLSICFMIDTSMSMRTTDPSGLRFTAAKLLIALLDPGDSVCLNVFSSGSYLRVPLTKINGQDDKVALMNELDNIATDGNTTDMLAAFRDVAHTISEDKSGNPRALVLLTDGRPSLVGSNQGQVSPDYLNSTIDYGKQANASLFAIALTPEGESPFLLNLTQAIGNGSQTFSATTSTDILDSYLYILRSLKGRIIFGTGEAQAPTDFILSIHPDLESSIKSISFVATHDVSATVSFISPQGTELQSSGRRIYELYGGPNYKVYTLTEPVTGNWTVRFGGSGGGLARVIATLEGSKPP